MRGCHLRERDARVSRAYPPSTVATTEGTSLRVQHFAYVGTTSHRKCFTATRCLAIEALGSPQMFIRPVPRRIKDYGRGASHSQR